MGAAKDIWMEEVERVRDELAAGNLTHDEAIILWHRLGFDKNEARDMALEAVS